MNISARTEYACIAVLELAVSYGSDDPIRIRQIAEKHGIPSRFLVQILLQLKSAGIVSSTRGASGGYRLVRNPKEISLGEVMSVIEGSSGPPSASADRDSSASRTLHQTWTEITKRQDELLDSITFADLHEQMVGQAEAMYYI